jgi:hypothetical protein
MGSTVEELERAIVGPVTADDATAWLDRHVRRRRSLGVGAVLFRSGRLAAVYGLQLTNGIDIVAKVYRAAEVERLAVVVACQRLLADTRYPCPSPVDGPVAIDWVASCCSNPCWSTASGETRIAPRPGGRWPTH